MRNAKIPNKKWHALWRDQVIQPSAIISSVVDFVFVYTQS